jgi:hypothetical protein
MGTLYYGDIPDIPYCGLEGMEFRRLTAQREMTNV